MGVQAFCVCVCVCVSVRACVRACVGGGAKRWGGDWRAGRERGPNRQVGNGGRAERWTGWRIECLLGVWGEVERGMTEGRQTFKIKKHPSYLEIVSSQQFW